MAQRTIAQLDAELLLRMGNRTDVTSVQRGFFLQDAYLRVAAEYEHVQLQGGPFNETVPLNNSTLTPIVATDLWWPVVVKDVTHGFVLTTEDMQVIDNMVLSPSQPRRYYWWGGTFHFDCFMEATTAIELKYKKKPPNPIASGQTSVLDEMYDLMIVLRAAKIAMETVRDWSSADQLAGLYKEYETSLGMVPTAQGKLDDWRNGVVVRMR